MYYGQTIAEVLEYHGFDIDEHEHDLYDVLNEIADLSVPVYVVDVVDEWRVLGCPDPEEDYGSTGIVAQMSYAIYENVFRELCEMASEEGYEI